MSCKLKSQTAKERGEKYSPIVPLECMNFSLQSTNINCIYVGSVIFNLTLLWCVIHSTRNHSSSWYTGINCKPERSLHAIWKQFCCNFLSLGLIYVLWKRRSFMWWFRDNVIYHFVEDPCVHLVIYYGEEISHWLVSFCQIRGKGLLYIKILCTKL